MSNFFFIQKYKPLYRPFLSRSRYNQTTIYGLMSARDYSIFQEIEIGDEKIKNYNKYVEKYLTEYFAEGSTTDDSPYDYIYVWYVQYPKHLLEEKTLIIFRKRYALNSDYENNTER